MLPVELGGQRRFCRVDRKRNLDGALLEVTGDLVSRVAEHLEHAPVVGQGRCDESADALDSSDRGEMLEEKRPQAMTLLRVVDYQRDLRRIPRDQAVVA